MDRPTRSKILLSEVESGQPRRPRHRAADNRRRRAELSEPDQAEPHPRIPVIGSFAPGQIQQLAAIAPGLTEVELRVLIELANRSEPPEFTGRVSQRMLALSTGCGRESVKRAIAGLERKKLATMRPGATTQEDGTPFRCEFLRTAPMTGGLTMSPPAESTRGWQGEFSTEVDSPWGHPVSPPPTENEQLTMAAELPRARVGSVLKPDPITTPDREQKKSTASTPEQNELGIIDRVLSARPRDYSEQQHARARSAIMGHVVKFPAPLGEYNRPPDHQITAQLLAVAEWYELEAFFLQLRIDRVQSGEKYAWFVTVAMKHIHGIKPERLKAERDARKPVKQLPKLLAAAKKLGR